MKYPLSNLIKTAIVTSANGRTQNYGSFIRVCLVILLAMVLCEANFAQFSAQEQLKVDSLNEVIKSSSTPDTTLIDSYHELAWLYYLNLPDKAIEYCEQAAELSQEINNESRLADSFGWLGYLLQQKGLIQEALEYNFKTLALQEGSEESKSLGTTYNNIAMIYDDQKDFDKSLEYHRIALELRTKIDDQEGIAESLNNIGWVYSRTGAFDSAAVFIYRSIEINKAAEDSLGVALGYSWLGRFCEERGKNDSALFFYKAGLHLGHKLKDKKGVANCYSLIGDLFSNIGELDSAKYYAELSMAMAIELGYPDAIKSAANSLVLVGRLKGNYREALEMYELEIKMRDSVNNEKTQKATIRQQTKYEFEKAQLVKEQEENEQARVLAEETSRRDNLQYSVILLGLLVLGSLILGLGKLALPPRMAEGIIFFSFLILFEFLLVLADPYIDRWSGGAPGIKLLFNAGIAALIFPMHSLFERKLKGRLINQET